MRHLLVLLGMVLLPLQAWAGGPAAAHKPPPAFPPLAPRPQVRPHSPPIEQLPGPLSEARRLEFDRLRTAGILHYRVGRYVDAEAYFRRALAIRPDDPITQAWLRAAEDAQNQHHS